jgi:hypothetical protein
MYSRLFRLGKPEPVYYESQWVRAPTGGILLNEVRLGAYVAQGQELGAVVDPITNVRTPIRARTHGRLIGMAVNLHTEIEKRRNAAIVAEWKGGGIDVSSLARRYGLSERLIYSILKEENGLSINCAYRLFVLRIPAKSRWLMPLLRILRWMVRYSDRRHECPVPERRHQQPHSNGART